jgi:protein-tyrosine-phosphatase
MKIVMVCAMNQARSPFAHAVLQRNFPEYEISSCGVRAILNTAISQDVVAVAKEWAVPILKKTSTSVDFDQEEILAADLVICADPSYKENIRAVGYEGKLVSYDEFIFDQDFMPIDPVGYRTEQLKRELAKIGALSIRATLEFAGVKAKHPIFAVIPYGTSDCELALAHAQLERKIRGAVLIDSDLRAPIEVEASEIGLARVEFDCENLENEIALGVTDTQILSVNRHLDNPESVFLDSKWRNWLLAIAENQPIVLLTGPRHSKARPLPDSYFAAILADEVMVIAS